jgi:hypothetical protein
LTISVQEAEKLGLEQIRVFIEASEGIRFAGENRQQVYVWIEQVLRQRQYGRPGLAGRGLLRRFLEKMTGLSQAQVTRLITRYQAAGTYSVQPRMRNPVPSAVILLH